MGMGFAPTWLRQVSPLLHITTLTTAPGLIRHRSRTAASSCQSLCRGITAPTGSVRVESYRDAGYVLAGLCVALAEIYAVLSECSFIARQHAYARTARYCFSMSVRLSVRNTLVLYLNEGTHRQTLSAV